MQMISALSITAEASIYIVMLLHKQRMMTVI